MPTLHLLGTGAALSDGDRTTTMLAFQDEGSTMVVDCGGDVIQRLLAAGVPIDGIEALILTHEHPDHVGGFPLFMEKIWLAQRRRPIPVYGPESAISQARRIFEAFDTSGWEGMPEIHWNPVPLNKGTEVLRGDRWHITAAPGEHSVPVIGLRVEHAGSGGVVAYSADTAPSNAVIGLARDAGLLVHEAGGDHPGHTTIEAAARVAARAAAGQLVLVHLPPNLTDRDLDEGRKIFPRIEFGRDGAVYEF